MADEWATGDGFEKTKLNRKTRFVGTGEQATAFLDSPQIGQQVYCTESDSTFTIDKLSSYNSSSTWVTPNVDESSELSETIGTATSGFDLGTNSRVYRFFTMPSSYKWYVITAIKAYPSNAVTPTIYNSGVDLVNADPPTLTGTPLIALCPLVSKVSGDDTKVTTIFSRPIRGGTVVGVWASYATASSEGLMGNSGTLSSQNRYKDGAYTATPSMMDSTAWTASTSSYAFILYYRGYN